MTSREIFKATLDFANPPRIAMTLPQPYPNDICCVGQISKQERLEPQGHELRRWRDEWENVWASLTEFDKGEIIEGGIADWSQLDGYTPPDLGASERYAKMKEKFAAHPDHFHVAMTSGFTFSVARKIRKLENYLCDLVTERENIDRLHDRILPELLKAVDACAAADADAVMVFEDWGTQDRLMVSPEMWREIFKPQIKTFCDRAHEHSMYVIMHSCGKMTAVIEDLIEIGVNAMQFDQPTLHGIDSLSENFSGRMAFWCPVDVQKTLQTRDTEKIRGEARQLIEKLGRGGGFIAGYYNGNEALGLPPKIQDIACKAFVEFAELGRA